jgi:hypothetical protein
MALSVITIAQHDRLARRESVKAELGLTAVDALTDALVDSLLDHSSAGIRRHCRRPFARETYSETLPGYGDVHLQLSRTPIVVVTQVLSSADVIPTTDYSIADAGEGTLYRQAGWQWSAQALYGLSGRQRWPGFGQPMPRSEEPTFTVAYTAGYILPPQRLLGAVSVSADGTDDSFNDSASGFPALLKAGDVIQTAGFANAANNGRFVVSGTPTAAKIVVSASLTTEAASPAVTLTFPEPTGLPMDVEKACIEEAKARYLRRSSDPDVVEKQAGPMRVRYGEPDAVSGAALCATAVALLRPWVRWAA